MSPAARTAADLRDLAPSRLDLRTDHTVAVQQIVPVEVTEGRGARATRHRGALGVGVDRSTGGLVFGLTQENQVASGRDTVTQYSMVDSGQIGLSADSAADLRDIGENLAQRIDDGVDFDGEYSHSSVISPTEVTRALQELRVPADVPYGVELPSLYDHFEVGDRLAERETDMRAQFDAEEAIEDRLALKEQQAVEAEPELAGYMELTDDVAEARRMLQQESGPDESAEQDPRTDWCEREHMVQDGIDRLRETVDSWNPHNPAMKPKIEQVSGWATQSQNELDRLQRTEGAINEAREYDYAPGTEPPAGAIMLLQVQNEVSNASSVAGVKAPTSVRSEASRQASHERQQRVATELASRIDPPSSDHALEAGS